MSATGRAERDSLGTVEQVRNTVNDELPADPENPDAEPVHAVPKATIERALTAARVTVDSEARGGPTTSQLREAVIAVAARKLMGYDSAVKQIQGADESVTWDTAALHSRLDAEAEQALSNVRQFFSVSP